MSEVKVLADVDVDGTVTAENGVLSHVEGTNDGTNWTNLTIDGTTKAIPTQRTITYGTADPSGGSDGDIYIKYTA